MAISQDQQKQTMSMDPFKMNPEKADEQYQLEKDFDALYSNPLKNALGGDASIYSLIRGKYLQNGWNLQKALQNSVNELSLTPEERQELFWNLKEVLAVKDSQDRQEPQNTLWDQTQPVTEFPKREKQAVIPKGVFDKTWAWTEKTTVQADPKKVPNNALIPEEQSLDPKLALSWKSQEQDGQQQMFESPEYVILARYQWDGKIDAQTSQKIQDEVMGWKSFAESIEANVQDPVAKKSLLEAIDDDPKNEEAQRIKKQGDFVKDFGDLAGWDAKMKRSLEIDNVFEAIASNYSKIPQKDGQFDKDRDFSTAVQVAHRKILAESPNLSRDTESYKQAVADIESRDHTREYRGLKYVYQEGNAWDAKEKKIDDQTRDAFKETDLSNLAKITWAERIQELLKAHQANTQRGLDKSKQTQEQARMMESQDRDEIPEIAFEVPSANPQEKMKAKR